MARILALDWGERRLGLAVSDPSETIATTLPTVTLKRPEDVLSAALEAVREHEPACVVVGLPLDREGGVGETARRVLDFAAALRARIASPVETWDERGTSALAEQSLHEEGWRAGRRRGGGRERTRARRGEEKGRVDARAAAILLQSWLDARPRTGGTD